MGKHPSIPQTTGLETDRPTWQTWLNQNRAEVEERLAPLRERSDGMLCFELSGSQFIVVNKEGSVLRLGLVEQGEAKTVLVQSKLDLQDPFKLITPYNQAALLGLLWSPQPLRVYAVGLGGGRIPMVLFHHLPQARFECTEIAIEMIPIAVDYFGLPCDERFEVIIQDGRDFLVEGSEVDPGAPAYDLMIVDVALGNGFIPYPLVTQEFYQLCRSHLSPNSVLVINWLSQSPGLADRIKTLHSTFDSIYYCRPDQGNIVMFAPMDPRLNLEDLRERARSLQNHHQFPFPFVELADQLGTGDDLISELSGWDQARILTDAEPPADYRGNSV